MLLNIQNCVYDNRNLFQKQKNWQGFLNISTIVFLVPQMIHAQCKILRAELLLNLVLQWWFMGNFSANFHKCHVNSSYRSQTKTHSALDTGIQSQMTSDAYGQDLCTIQLREMWNCPKDELQSVLLCISLKNVNWTRGEGEILICPRLSSGHRWPRHVCGSGR